jgi:2,3-bisphosphoglycerate-independent phosphoglycerate mutase
VKFLLLDSRIESTFSLRAGKLADVAPTVLSALGFPQPIAMTGQTLAPNHDWGGKRRVMLVILDGWGIGREDNGNPIFISPTPRWDDLLSRFPNTQLDASGEVVGLQAGKTGNSEAGHMNLGSGRVVLQDDVRLDTAMKDGSFYSNEILLQTIHEVKQRGKNLHLIGLLTEKSSHGSIDYPLAVLRMAKNQDLDRVYLHMIFDGRSTNPGSAPALLETFEQRIEEIGTGKVVSGVGRGIALDRDGNYAKIQRAFDALTSGKGKHCRMD